MCGNDVHLAVEASNWDHFSETLKSKWARSMKKRTVEDEKAQDRLG